ncbi:hypothetical protein Ancab_021000 [Ancistrocladus abbreviatus]
MVPKEIDPLHNSPDSDQSSKKQERCEFTAGKSSADSQTTHGEVQDGTLSMEDWGQGKEQNPEAYTLSRNLDKDVICETSPLKVELVTHVAKTDSFGDDIDGEKDCQMDQKKNISSGVKRTRMRSSDQGSSLHIFYSSLPRRSQQKLQELLHQWSEWHAQNCSTEDPNEALESGEETYFPALHIGLDKSLMVSFWMDNHARKRQCKESLTLEDDCTTLYNREYALGLMCDDGLTKDERNLDLREASRCFNCGSYNHSLKECPKPRNNVAVSNARKQHQSKKGVNPGPRLPTRYYQNSPGGKYDGLKPGLLEAETRNLLGLEELDPPPWLHRMRELGYPPGYLDPEDEDQPSGIAIYGVGKMEDAAGNGNLKSEIPISQRKMSVDFPGINAPIPENADERCWTTQKNEPSLDSSRRSLDVRRNNFAGSVDDRNGHDPWRPRSFTEASSSHYGPGSSHLMAGYRQTYTHFTPYSRGIPIARSPSYWSPVADRGRYPLHDNSPVHGSYNFLPHSSPSPSHLSLNYGSPYSGLSM